MDVFDRVRPLSSLWFMGDVTFSTVPLFTRRSGTCGRSSFISDGNRSKAKDFSLDRNPLLWSSTTRSPCISLSSPKTQITKTIPHFSLSVTSPHPFIFTFLLLWLTQCCFLAPHLSFHIRYFLSVLPPIDTDLSAVSTVPPPPPGNADKAFIFRKLT